MALSVSARNNSHAQPTVSPSLSRNGKARKRREKDPPEILAAKAAGLRYVSDREPGIRRRRHRESFRYLDSDGMPIRDRDAIARINALAIPPAWTDVWICRRPNGHLQATGRDARGRKQYRYHAAWTAARGETKYDKLRDFGHALPHIREQVEIDLALPGLPREKVIATVVRLLETTLIRVGNEEYARSNESFGLTTLRDDHVDVGSTAVTFTFRGKSGKEHEVGLRDRRLASVVRRCRDLPGQMLFQYPGSDGEAHPIDSGDVNGYLKAATGEPFTAKDFRTWHGTVLAARSLLAAEPAESETDRKRAVTRAIEAVAMRLGNTATVCRKSYVHPTIIERYLAGTLDDAARRIAATSPMDATFPQSEDERLVMALLG